MSGKIHYLHQATVAHGSTIMLSQLAIFTERRSHMSARDPELCARCRPEQQGWCSSQTANLILEFAIQEQDGVW